MLKTRSFFTALFLLCAADLPLPAQAEQFISLNLCSDRLLIELARPEQIAAMSPYSQKPLMMLEKVNRTKPVVEPNLLELLPYQDKTILLNPQFYPRLTEQLKQLGVKVVPVSDPHTAEQLFALIEQLGELTGNPDKAERLIEQLRLPKTRLNTALTDTLILTETGVADQHLPRYQALLDLLGLSALKEALTPQNFSLETLLLAQPNRLISITDKQSYNAQSALLSHPILQKIFPHRTLATLPMKYTYCFDHGLWQGAERVYRQLK
ncbi:MULTISPECIES: helical backbone metal receptor [Pasteurellaceae]|uniref:helical backbone metal receptor n=1 Tax=Pasteurellaceae TaxID=712 RepID=UPI00356A2475